MGIKRAWSRKDRAKRRLDWSNENPANPNRPVSSPDENLSRPTQRIRPALADQPKQVLEYYTPAFAWLHLKLFEEYENGIDSAMHMRRSFWHLVPDGIYETEQAQELIQGYSESVERRLAEEIRTHSISFWLYIYRRTAPGAVGPNDSPATTMLVRQRLEAAFQKYAPQGKDRSIAWSDEVETEQILACVPIKCRPPEMIRKILSGPRDLVLTDFSVEDLAQLYRCEQLAYEVWRCGAAARITSKGAKLIVDYTSKKCFFDARTDELNTLVKIYDGRESPFIASATATVFERTRTEIGNGGMVNLPYYNVVRTDATMYAELFARQSIGVGPNFKFNFEWFPFDVKAYCESHAFLSDPFNRKHGFRFEVTLIVLMALLYRMWEVWEHKPMYMYQALQRSYTGPSLLANVQQIITEDAVACADILEVERPSAEELRRAIDFLTLSEKKKSLISLPTGGPCFLFLPSEEGRVIVDFAWTASSLHYLFLGVPLSEKGAKGKLLESLVGGTSALPTGKCKTMDNSSRQVDAAFRFGKTLVIVECKANARSIAYERGDLAALKYRRRAFEEALRQVDDKATWLSAHPKGTNYDISDIEAILPVVVTPFKEFMPSLDARYWIKPELPRVLMPHELKSFLGDPNIQSTVSRSRSTIFVPILINPETLTQS